ncbi:glycosyltransferase family 2 protein [Pseudazoarcus pumilus]|nr:glycosyltransferase family A protein [Pseudazoarcus pumilus]
MSEAHSTADGTPPLVSVVMATYNRSNIIGYAIESLRANTLQDWELLVVGDCCTDDTETVVSAFGDTRIRFVNLPDNCGEQSGPNNFGVELARGRYLAFLNHDDLWFPHHLRRCVEALEREGVDLVFSQGIVVDADGKLALVGATCPEPHPYAPWMSAPASLWVMRREVPPSVGAWPAARETRISPSQAWLRRAHGMGVRMLALPVPGALIITSGDRRDSYRERQCAEHAWWHDKLRADGGERALIGALLGELWQQRTLNPGYNLGHLAKTLVRRSLMCVGIPAPSIKGLFRFRRKGAFIAHLRRVRGLEPAKRGSRTEDGH